MSEAHVRRNPTIWNAVGDWERDDWIVNNSGRIMSPASEAVWTEGWVHGIMLTPTRRICTWISTRRPVKVTYCNQNQAPVQVWVRPIPFLMITKRANCELFNEINPTSFTISTSTVLLCFWEFVHKFNFHQFKRVILIALYFKTKTKTVKPQQEIVPLTPWSLHLPHPHPQHPLPLLRPRLRV